MQRLTGAGLLISLGIIYGDIGTSPLYVFKAIIGTRIDGSPQPISELLVLGGVSLIFWTLTLQTTLKYVVITLRADNKGEGGIFSLFSLVRRKAKWLIVPAVVGGCALLADGIITPPITISSAIEGLESTFPHLHTMPIVIGILAALFIIQQFGTSLVGKAFGPIMFLWFTMLGVLGLVYVMQDLSIFRALNPYYAIRLMTDHSYHSFIILGAVFLCTTGAEALYSDLGHCGRSNIQVSWGYVKTALVLNYLGQAVWLLQHKGQAINLNLYNPFYQLMPPWFLNYGIGIATIAAIIASQALISGSFTLIAEAVRLNLWPKVRINYPSDQKGQLYVPSVNWLLCAGCIGVILLFRHSDRMEAAYGLSITVAMLMTTILVSKFLRKKKVPNYIVNTFLVMYLFIEGTFLVGNLNKFVDGGWFTLSIGLLLFSIMWTWHIARRIRNRYVKFIEIEDYYTILKELSEDETVPKYASQLVYLTSANFDSEIESKIIYSILQKQPKRADVYWLVHVDVLDEPYRKEYEVNFLVPNKLIRVDFKLGFRVEQQINLLFRKVVEDLVRNNEVNITSQYKSLNKHKIVGDFRFVVIDKVLSRSHNLSFYEKAVMFYYGFLKHLSLTEERGFGLDMSFVTVEKVPLMLADPETVEIRRISEPPPPVH